MRVVKIFETRRAIADISNFSSQYKFNDKIFTLTEREQKTKEKGSKKPYLKIKFNQLITDFKMHKFKTGHLQTRTKNLISLV